MLIQSSELTARPGKNGTLGPTVTKMRDVLSEASGIPFTAWLAFAGRPYGTYVLSAQHANHAAMIGSMMQTAASAAWGELASVADGVLDAPAPSYLAEVIAVTGEAVEPKQFTVVTAATMSGTDLARSMAWSVEVAEHVSKITGQSGVVATAVAGSMFRVVWISGVDAPEELDSVHGAVTADSGYIEMLAEAGSSGLFVPGSTDRVMLARMA